MQQILATPQSSSVAIGDAEPMGASTSASPEDVNVPAKQSTGIQVTPTRRNAHVQASPITSKECKTKGMTITVISCILSMTCVVVFVAHNIQPFKQLWSCMMLLYSVI